MPEIIAGAIITFLAIFGAVELLSRLKRKLLKSAVKGTAIVVAASGHDEEIEYSVRSLVSQADDLETGGERFIVVVDNGMDEETRKICEKIKSDFCGVEVCKMSELSQVFERQLQS